MILKIATLPKKALRYNTIGDWSLDANGDISVLVAEMGNRDYEFLVGIHELIEAYLCHRNGVTQDAVDQFDFNFERDRQDGIHGTDDEPGAHADAPYRLEHITAECIERKLAGILKVNWLEYDKAVRAL